MLCELFRSAMTSSLKRDLKISSSQDPAIFTVKALRSQLIVRQEVVDNEEYIIEWFLKLLANNWIKMNWKTDEFIWQPNIYS